MAEVGIQVYKRIPMSEEDQALVRAGKACAEAGLNYPPEVTALLDKMQVDEVEQLDNREDLVPIDVDLVPIKVRDMCDTYEFTTESGEKYVIDLDYDA